MISFAYNLVPQLTPMMLRIGEFDYAFESLSPEQLASIGWLPLIHDTDDAPLGYADPVQETRDGHLVAVQYALGTPEERAIAMAATRWAAQAAIRKQQAATRMAADAKAPTNARLLALKTLTGH